MKRIRALSLASLLAAGGLPAAAQDAPQDIPFEGGTLTITETDDFSKVLTFEGRELARDYVVSLDRMVELGDTRAALFWVGPGGNACGPSVLIVWKPEGSAVQSQTVGEGECGTAPAAATQDRLYFVPYLSPGGTGLVRAWSPDDGLEVAGELVFAPQPGTGWKDIDAAKLDHPYDLFANSEVYAAAKALLGDDLDGVMASLGTAAKPEADASGRISGNGCIPHACGTFDAFVAADPAAQKLYFARQEEDGLRYWPQAQDWPAAAKAKADEALGGQ